MAEVIQPMGRKAADSPPTPPGAGAPSALRPGLELRRAVGAGEESGMQDHAFSAGGWHDQTPGFYAQGVRIVMVKFFASNLPPELLATHLATSTHIEYIAWVVTKAKGALTEK
ncbi:MAG: hypothetical protein NTZ50_09910 [Chloroflexi bacterium]|nr:hypothetical protein [Chloroflexota bacterium]